MRNSHCLNPQKHFSSNVIGKSSWQLGLSWKHVLWAVCFPPQPPTPEPPHASSVGLPAIPAHTQLREPQANVPSTVSPLELMHRGRCGPYCPPRSGKG